MPLLTGLKRKGRDNADIIEKLLKLDEKEQKKLPRSGWKWKNSEKKDV